MTDIVVRAPAKLNLRLVVLAREISGYHQLETLFAQIELADVIAIAEGEPGIRLGVDGADLGDAADNLVVRAARAWSAAAGIEARFDIRLRKEIPAGAGLGGGSSDAAATLRALNEAAAVPLPLADLVRIATELGSDVAFFLAGAPYALAWGRGERCLRLPAPPQRHVVLGIADAPVSTALAYARLDGSALRGKSVPLPDIGALTTWQGITAIAENVFEPVLLPEMPGARVLLETFRQHGAELAMMTGSGAAVFGTWPGEAAAETALDAAQRALPHAWVRRTRTDFGPDAVAGGVRTDATR